MQFTPEHRAEIRASQLKGEEKKHAEERLHAIQQSKKLTGEMYANVPLVNPQRIVRVWQYNSPPGKRHVWDSSPIPVKLDDAGVYVLEATDGQRQAQVILIASQTVLLARGEEGKLEIRSVDATSGEPRGGVNVTLTDPKTKQTLGQAMTDADGLSTFPLPDVPETGLLALAQHGGDFTALSVAGFQLRPDPGMLDGAVYTDRPVYRPGHEVKFKALVRKKAAVYFSLPDDKRVNVEVTSPEGQAVYRTKATLNEFGTVNGGFTLAADAPTGNYGIHVQQEVYGVYGTFSVEEYRKPEYEVKLTTGSPRILQGATQRIALNARYYYGEPVRAGTVEWHIFRTQWYPPWWDEGESFGDDEGGEGGGGSYRGEEIGTRKGSLNPDGTAALELTTAAANADQTISVEAQVTDAGGRAISGATSFLATIGPYYLRAEGAKYVYTPGETGELRVSSMDYDGNAVPNIAFSADVVLHEWQAPPKINLTGERGKSTSRTIATLRGVTGPDGRGNASFTAPGAGYYTLQVHSNTSAGRTLQASASFSVSGSGASWGWNGEDNSIRLIADKKTYKPGDTAHVLVVTGTPGNWVWFSVESRRVRWSKWIHMTEAAQTVDFPVQAEWTPTIFAQAYTIRDGKFRRGTKMLSIPPAHRTLAVKVIPEKREFKPGEPAVYNIEARDASGRPVKAEFSLGVVDEAIYAIERDPLPNLVKSFYDREWDHVFSASSLEWNFYAQAGRKSLQLAAIRPQRPFGQLKPERPPAPRIRKNFPDTAYWNAELRTGADGKARAQFEFPDSLTTWRATARGITADTLVGSAFDKVLVRKRLILSFATPRFAVEGDALTVPVIVRNSLPQSQTVKLTLQASGAEALTSPPASVQVQPNGEARFDWKLRAGSSAAIKLTGKAEAQGESDGLEITFPVEPWGLAWHAGTMSVLSATGDSKTMNLTIPDSARAETRHVKLTAAPSMAASLLGSLDFLTGYPYGCTEQAAWIKPSCRRRSAPASSARSTSRTPRAAGASGAATTPTRSSPPMSCGDFRSKHRCADRVRATK